MSLRVLVVVMFFAGCVKKPVFDLSIPDAPSAVSAQEPDSILEDASRADIPSVRARALALGIAVHSSDRPRWVGRAAYDPDAWVQIQGVDAAAPFASDPAVREVLVTLATRDTADAYARSHVAVVLARTGGSDVAAVALSGAVQRARDPWTRSALALGALALGDDSAADAVASAVSRGDIALELTFIDDLARTDAPVLTQALASAASAVEDELVIAVATARLMRGDSAGEATLLAALRDDDPLRQLAVLDAVRTVANTTSIVKAGMRASDPAARDYAALIRDAQRGRLSDRYRQLIDSDDPELRLAALDLLPTRQADRNDARDLARLALLDDVPRVRAAAARQLGELGLDASQNDEARLRPLLTDEDILVRVEAAGALMR